MFISLRDFENKVLNLAKEPSHKCLNNFINKNINVEIIYDALKDFVMIPYNSRIVVGEVPTQEIFPVDIENCKVSFQRLAEEISRYTENIYQAQEQAFSIVLQYNKVVLENGALKGKVFLASPLKFSNQIQTSTLFACDISEMHYDLIKEQIFKYPPTT